MGYVFNQLKDRKRTGYDEVRVPDQAYLLCWYYMVWIKQAECAGEH